MAEFPSPYEFVKHAFEAVQYGGKLLSEWVEEINKHKWISVEERLPEPFVSVIVYMPEEAPCPTVHEGYLRPDNKSWYSELFVREFDEVTHWMPLPEPPKDVK